MSAAAAAALKVAKPSKKTLAATAAAEEEERIAAEEAAKLAEEEALAALQKHEPAKRTFLVEADLDTVLELPALPSDLRALVSYIKNMLALVEEDSISKGYLLMRNVGRENPKVVLDNGWLDGIFDNLENKSCIIRCSAASALAAVAGTAEGRESLPLETLPVLVDMLHRGMKQGIDSHDVKYSTLALANIAISPRFKGRLVGLGTITPLIELVRATIIGIPVPPQPTKEELAEAAEAAEDEAAEGDGEGEGEGEGEEGDGEENSGAGKSRQKPPVAAVKAPAPMVLSKANQHLQASALYGVNVLLNAVGDKDCRAEMVKAKLAHMLEQHIAVLGQVEGMLASRCCLLHGALGIQELIEVDPRALCETPAPARLCPSVNSNRPMSPRVTSGTESVLGVHTGDKPLPAPSPLSTPTTSAKALLEQHSSHGTPIPPEEVAVV